MNEEYDAIVIGTGLKECILSGLLSVKGKKVLHLDRNGYYGGETASLNLTNLWKMFREGEEPPKQFGHNRDWNVDIIPKFIIANGLLVKMLLHTKVTKYLEWKCIDASFVMQYQKGGMLSSAKTVIHKVPANDSEALKSPLMGLFEKKRLRNLYIYVDKVDENDPKTWDDIDLRKQPISDVFKKFKLEDNTIDFMGHAVGLYRDDSYLSRPAIETIARFKLYTDSVGKYGDSPFLYPVYGLGGIPESFSRLCAIHGGTYMLNMPVDEILFEDGKVSGIRCGQDTAKAPLVICDPTYTKDLKKTKVIGKVVRAICIMDHPIPNTNNVSSIQIILPQKQLNRNSDIYVTMVSSEHAVCAKGLYIAIVSTTVETNNPEAEIEPALKLLGNILEMFVSISDIHEPINDAKSENLFITKSYDATSHFESASLDVLAIYE
eukprot:CAMPEP_0176374508 /NCGR_PEP_ID=MMETSP0126-20121128/26808_1 /TAXON_ID=141414 ORGANISM="Strombidinopsis acuminatum, Strain SPMC142" /NCGR_SAMPLE_ID=MMETSP0126 /ASSEMBLY_ACC=CAM_ASM_000229 /LENGTH=433 /DNA_ID=CAMNT_0017735115 /DNA_START=42 /DNA_END=1340 /DNA_ORIENTATION=+